MFDLLLSHLLAHQPTSAMPFALIWWARVQREVRFHLIIWIWRVFLCMLLLLLLHSLCWASLNKTILICFQWGVKVLAVNINRPGVSVHLIFQSHMEMTQMPRCTGVVNNEYFNSCVVWMEWAQGGVTLVLLREEQLELGVIPRFKRPLLQHLMKIQEFLVFVCFLCLDCSLFL